MKFKDWLKIYEDAGLVHGTYANDGPFTAKIRSNKVANGDFSPPKNNLPPIYNPNGTTDWYSQIVLSSVEKVDKKTSKKRKTRIRRVK
jgi:hypothetical protein